MNASKVVAVWAFVGLAIGCGASDPGAQRHAIRPPGLIGVSRGARSDSALQVSPGHWTFEIGDPGEGVTVAIAGEETAEHRTMLITVAVDAPITRRTVPIVVTGCDDDCTVADERVENYELVVDVIDQYK